MRLDWMMLANHAEIREGLLMMIGGTWDTVQVPGDPPPGQPAAVIRGVLVARLLASRSEAGHEYPFQLRVMDADGGQVASAEGSVVISINPTLPQGWEQGSLLTVDLTGLPLPSVGFYEIGFFVGGNHMGSLAFRVVQAAGAP